MDNLIKKYGKLKVYKKGSLLIKQDFPLVHLYFLVKGKCKAVRYTEDGKVLLLELFSNDGILGDIELMLNEPIAQTSIATITDVEAYTIPISVCNKLKQTDLEFSNYIAIELAKKLHKTSKQISLNNIMTVDQRLTQYILYTCENNIFDENLVELSQLLAVSYRHLLRTINNLCEKDILIIDKKSSPKKRRYLINKELIK